jgi:pimeloyl-ACP methyl ester carboxylesterase
MTSFAIGPLVGEGEGDGFPVVMIHGLGGTGNMFQPQLGALAGHRIIRLDLPGSGRSPRPVEALSVEGMTSAVITALRSLGVGQAHFVGHSMGTMVCQQAAVSEPALVASLTLFGALAEPLPATREGLGKRAALARSGGMADIADQIVANAISAHTRETNPAAVAFVRESVMRQDPESYARTCEALAKAETVDLRLIAAPTLLVTGDADTVNAPSVAQTLADKISGAVFRSMDRCGHWATIEKAQESGRLLADFLRQVER